MSARLMNVIMLVLVAGAAVGCAPGEPGVAEAGGFFQGLADGFLILAQFLGGYFTGSDNLRQISMDTPYGLGYVAGALSFFGLGTAFSAP